MPGLKDILAEKLGDDDDALASILEQAEKEVELKIKTEHKGLLNKRDELIAKYAKDLKEKCGVNADMDLLTNVTIGCGPSIYNADASTLKIIKEYAERMNLMKNSDDN